MNRQDPRPYFERVKPGLVPIAGGQNEVCGTCRSGANPGYQRCYRCKNENVVEVLPISMSVHGELLHDRLRWYKDGNEQQKQDYTLQLAALLLLFLGRHLKCIGGNPDAVATVSSEKRDAVKNIVDRTANFRGMHAPLARTRSDNPPTFQAPDSLKDKKVLLLDDTFTTGRSITAAYRALSSVGAELLTPVVIGRHFRPGFATSERLHTCLKNHEWRLDRCGICAPIMCDGRSQAQLL